ncbi:MAG: hypothetical protein ACRDWA_09990 [Acidimicrobiia bacterium]
MGSRRFLALLLALFFVIGLTIPLGATTTTGASTATTAGAGTATTAGEGAATTVGETATTAEPIVPAVSVEVTEAPETQPDWTYRFFIPTLLVLAALVVIATVVQYFTRVVRKRYRVIR